MHLSYNIKTTTEDLVKPYNPTKLEIWIGAKSQINTGTEEAPIMTDVIEVATETTEDIEGGTRVEKRTRLLPLAALQPMVSGFDLGTGEMVISTSALNKYLSQYNLEII